MLAKPLLGAVADRFRLKKVLFITFQIITLISFLPINYIPAYKTESKVHFTCDILTLQGMFDTSSSGNETTVNNSTNYNCLITKLIEEMGSDGTVSCKVNCPSIADLGWTEAAPGFTAFLPVNNVSVYNNIAHFPFTEVELNSMATRDKVCKAAVNNITTMCDMKCNSETINDILEVTPLQTIDNAVDQYQFWIFLILAIIGWVGMATIYTVGDAICFEMLNDNPSAYGNQRVWGSIGYGIFSILGGLMVDHFSKGNSLAKKDFSSVFYLMIVMVALDIVCSLRLKYEQKHTSPNIAKDVGKLLLNAKILVYLLWCTFMGVMIAMVWSFLFWHLEDLATKSSGCDMNVWIRTLQGLVNGIQCLGGELPFLFLSGWILRKLGHVHCMSIILLAVGVRFVLYSILIDPWWALPIELIQGITFGLFYATMTSYASIVAPPGTEATVQVSIFVLMSEQLGHNFNIPICNVIAKLMRYLN